MLHEEEDKRAGRGEEAAPARAELTLEEMGRGILEAWRATVQMQGAVEEKPAGAPMSLTAALFPIQRDSPIHQAGQFVTERSKEALAGVRLSGDLDAMSARAGAATKLASLALVAADLESAMLKEQLGKTSAADSDYRKAGREAAKLLGPDHPLSVALAPYVNRPDAVQEQRLAQSNVTLTERGFVLTLRLPEAPNWKEFVKQILAMCAEAESAWKKEFGGYKAYGNEYSEDSSLNAHGRKGPKLLDPSGRLWGRVSRNGYGDESISNEYRDYGSPYRQTSLNYWLFGHPRDTKPFPDGEWRIVGDQT